MPVKAIQRDRSWKEIRTISSWLWVEGGSELITVNVSLFPGEPKGTELGEEIGKKQGICPPASKGWVHPSGGSRGQARTGRAGERSPQTAGVGCVTLGKSLSPWGLSFPETAKQALCKRTRWSPSIMETTGGSCRVQGRRCRKGLRRGLRSQAQTLVLWPLPG